MLSSLGRHCQFTNTKKFVAGQVCVCVCVCSNPFETYRESHKTALVEVRRGRVFGGEGVAVESRTQRYSANLINDLRKQQISMHGGGAYCMLWTKEAHVRYSF